MPLAPNIDSYMSIFHPLAREEFYRFEASKRPFVYYTRASTAISIITNGEFWMREASRMNDFREARHGLDCIHAAFNSSEGARSKAIFESQHPGVVADAMKALSADAEDLCSGTYISCISEHGDATGEEDAHGRLSMWRAYGGTEGVALILNPSPYFYAGPASLGVFSSPVAYLRDAGYVAALKQVNDAAQHNTAYIKALGADRTRWALINMLRFAAVCGKHPGFKEEREWRVLWNVTLGPPTGLIASTELINGTKQNVYKLPIKNIPGLGVPSVDTLIQRVIVGPCDKPDEVRQRIEAALASVGVNQPASRIVVSDIPLRHNAQ